MGARGEILYGCGRGHAPGDSSRRARPPGKESQPRRLLVRRRWRPADDPLFLARIGSSADSRTLGGHQPEPVPCPGTGAPGKLHLPRPGPAGGPGPGIRRSLRRFTWRYYRALPPRGKISRRHSVNWRSPCVCPRCFTPRSGIVRRTCRTASISGARHR